jgi:basic amino acid/polyamine antiporter, APA family
MKTGGARGAEAGGASPRPVLGVGDTVALILGIVIGAGIFRAPSAVAASVSGVSAAITVWIAGGLVSLAGAMCYAELAAAYPHAGGDYHFLTRALGRGTAFLFAWARLTVIPTGSVALLGFVFGDYAGQLIGRPDASGVLAAALVVALTAINVAGLHVAKGAQNVLTAALVAGLVLVIVAGFVVPAVPAGTAAAGGGGDRPALGLAMVFVLLAYGGWNEAAYVSSELRGGRRMIALALALGISAVTVLYVLANVAYLRGLGLEGVRRSDAVAADLLARALGPAGASAIAVVVIAAAVTSANATLLMGSRMVWAFGRDFHLFAPLGRWSGRAGSPVNALLVQGGIALLLVLFGNASRSGFEAMVAYTAPVFWLFFLLTGISLFVLRRKDPATPRPFRVPLYPVAPTVFCLACAYLLWSSLAYAGPGAVAGVAVLATGLIPLWWTRRAPARRPAAA